MASAGENTGGTTESSTQSPSVRHLEDLDGRISEREEQMELCTMILNDLLEIQKIVAKRGLENTTFKPDN